MSCSWNDPLAFSDRLLSLELCKDSSLCFYGLIARLFLAQSLGRTAVHPSPTEGRLSRFRVLVMNDAAINIHLQIFHGYELSAPLGKYRRARLLDRVLRVRLVL